ncbi:TPA: FCT-2 pilus minor pilin FctB, partial [Streptococcus pyogenes]|nr:FCT-2 pilus minor pilin FctB [Streptococcus pyogenes]
MKKSILRILAIGYLLMSFCLLDSVEAENLTASINIEVINQVDVATNKQSSDIDETFMFVIEALDKESPLPNSVTTSVKGNGKTSFEQLTFSEVGQYHYKIHQ